MTHPDVPIGGEDFSTSRKTVSLSVSISLYVYIIDRTTESENLGAMIWIFFSTQKNQLNLAAAEVLFITKGIQALIEKEVTK